MIKLIKVNKTFKDKTKHINAVVNVDLEVEKADIFGIVGSSGAGKSTLIRLLNRLETPDSGQIQISGVNITKLTKEELRHFRMQTGMIFQHFNLLWSRTVLQNIMLPLEITGCSKTERIKKARELLKLVDLEDKAHVYPSELSGGQKQRVGIARALANKPEVLLCDEATSALDPKTTDNILSLLMKINKELDITIVLITHEMNVIRKICNRVAVMNNGEVIEQGDVQEIFNYPKHEITKEFVAKELVSETYGTKFKKDHSKKLIKLVFTNDSTRIPLLRNLIVNYGLNPNILEAKVRSVQESQIGFLIVEIDSSLNLTEVRDYLKLQNVKLEVLNDAR
ncbi:ATP-binding cassette domain-containing protein [Mycoplasmatota bacterium zrk1]